jgi:Transposase DDE domain group 1
MDEATGEAAGSGLRVAFDRRLKLEFHGATVTSDAGLLAFRELDDALGLTALAAEVLADPRTGRNGQPEDEHLGGALEGERLDAGGDGAQARDRGGASRGYCSQRVGVGLGHTRV